MNLSLFPRIVGAVQTFRGVPQQLGAFAGSTALFSGEAGTAQTVSLAKKLVDSAVKDPAVNRLAIDIVRHTPQYDQLSKAEAIYNWCAANLYYIEDPIGPFGPKETLRPMRDLMELKAGDCDDINMVFIPSLLGTIGIQARAVTVKADPEFPHEFSHVYCEAMIANEWIPMDCARPGAGFGEAPPVYWERKEWPINFDQPISLMGYSGMGYPLGLGCDGCGGRCGCSTSPAPRRGLAGYVDRFPARTGLRGLGDDNNVAQDIQAATVGAAAVISAANQNPYSFLSTTNLATPGAPGLVSPQLGYGVSGSVQVSNWLPIILGGIFLLALVGRK